ncbi:hypothetical protein KY290_021908 [Solanum tuberosum]|uniref:Uncharacterized protein n=1 Tax=Solanum tuberosum TaxID=4113 RepID=A0ABQ7V2W6_SOLTU|nr:hypothetical protein KY289_021069 [Solanum tuberosum]KAH0693728.1 hypothetical protein KY285_020825 [Solanum tuberosum]KAH0758415.1 hypothetical protein KY290_021908 [Solanum tuberosum]
MVAGLFQPTGCPSVVAMIGNWFCKEECSYCYSFIRNHLGNKDEVLSPGKEDEELNKPLSRSNREEESAVGFREHGGFQELRHLLFLFICSNGESDNLSTLFDVKGVVGGILTGYISDQFDDRAITTASFMYCVITAPCLFRSYGHISVTINIILIIA